MKITGGPRHGASVVSMTSERAEGTKKRQRNFLVRNHFTLIELLVVVAIVAVLSGLLLPALAKAREKSKQIVCAGHLKQLGYAVFLYQSDWNGFFPVSNDTASRFENLEPYTKIKFQTSSTAEMAGIYFCPADGVRRRTDYCMLSYMWNSYCGWDSATPNMARGFTIRSPSTIIYSGDGKKPAASGLKFSVNTWPFKASADPEAALGSVDFRHFAQTTLLFCDGHTSVFGLPDLLGTYTKYTYQTN